MDYEFGRSRLAWRQTFVQPKLGPLDYRLIFFILPFFFYIRIWTLSVLLTCLLVFFILQKRRIEPDNILRWLRAKIAGPVRTAHGVARLRPAVDYGFETLEMVKAEERRQQLMRQPRKASKGRPAEMPPRPIGPSQLLPLRERFKVARSG